MQPVFTRTMTVLKYRGVTCRTLFTRLPRNLVFFDGHCLWCQRRAQYVLERNFSYFSTVAYYAQFDWETSQADAKLDRHKMHFASLDSSEAEDVKKAFFNTATAPLQPQQPSIDRSSWNTPAKKPPLPNELVILLVEKVPSYNATYLRRHRGSTRNADDKLFRPPSRVEASARVQRQGVESSALQHPEQTDLLVSTNFAAMCRIGMHLDRTLVRLVSRLLYTMVPTAVGNAVFQKFVCERRRRLWGSSEEDAVKQLGRIDGMRERRWAWRSVYSN